MSISDIHYCHPIRQDGRAVYKLIQTCPPLDLNSQYYYHIICHDFSQTCVIAKQHNEIIGFVSAYLKPNNKTSLFVWQVAVSEQARGHGLASHMLAWLTQQPSCKTINSLETTISPSNQASQKLFQRFATKHNSTLQTFPFLDASQFGNELHEDEILYRISPLTF